MKKLFFAFFCLLTQLVFCQRQPPAGSANINAQLNDLKGEPLNLGSSFAYEGSPFFNSEWSKGNLLLTDNRVYKNISMKLNLQANQVHYQNPQTNAEMVAGVGMVSEVEILDPGKLDAVRFRSKYPAIDKHDLKTFYQVLADGKVVLLKQVKKIFIEEKAFNSATITRRFNTQNSYYVFQDEKMARLKRSKSGILDVLSDQKELVEMFVSNNKLTIKSDDDLAKVFTYYNSLLP
jgi:hypothetical protein